MCWCYLLFIILWERLLAFSLTNSVHSHWIFFLFFILFLFLYISLRFWWITPGIPVGFTAIFIMFSTLRQELSEMLQVVVNNQFSDWLKPTRLPLPLTKRLNIFISASAPPAKPLAVCRFPHVSHWKWTRHSRLPRPVWKGLLKLQ